MSIRKPNGEIDWEALRNLAVFAAIIAVLYWFSSGSACNVMVDRWGGC